MVAAQGKEAADASTHAASMELGNVSGQHPREERDGVVPYGRGACVELHGGCPFHENHVPRFQGNGRAGVLHRELAFALIDGKASDALGRREIQSPVAPCVKPTKSIRVELNEREDVGKWVGHVWTIAIDVSTI